MHRVRRVVGDPDLRAVRDVHAALGEERARVGVQFRPGFRIVAALAGDVGQHALEALDIVVVESFHDRLILRGVG